MTGQTNQTDFLDAFMSPFQAYYSGFANMTQGFSPMKSVARSQLEVMGLMSRRAQALLELPSRIAKCDTPEAMANEQAAFWQTALEQCAETSQRIMEAWTGALAGSRVSGRGDERTADHDYITFPATRDQGTIPFDPSSAGRRPQRRVA